MKHGRIPTVSGDTTIQGDTDSVPFWDTIADSEAIDEDDSFSELRTHDVSEKLAKAFRSLQEREAAILRMRFGLDGHAPQSLRTIAGSLGLSKEGVRQLELRGVEKLRGLLLEEDFYELN